jgi:hypothetical protein
MIFPPPPPLQGLALGLEIKRARYSPAMRKQQTQFFLINNIAPRNTRGLTIERAAFG